MSHELIEKVNQLPCKSEPRNITLHDKSKYFENVENVQLEQNITITTSVNGNLLTSSINANNDFYNLFVLDNEDFAKTYFYIERNNLLKHIEDQVSKNHTLSDVDLLIENCTKYPCVFVNKNKTYKTASSDQKAYFGYLCKIEKYNTGLKFYFSFTCNLSQQIFNDNSKRLGIKSSKGNNELDTIHWSIKKVNLIDELFDLGYRVASY